MLCVRCSHPLSPRADRCLRCFALNPQNRPAAAAPAQRASRTATPVPPLAVSFESDPPLEAKQLSIVSDPPAGAVRMAFDDERGAATDPHEAVTDPPDVGERSTAAPRAIPTASAVPTASATPIPTLAAAAPLAPSSRFAAAAPLDDSPWTLGPASPPPSEAPFATSGSTESFATSGRIESSATSRSIESSDPSREPPAVAAAPSAPGAARPPAVSLRARLLAWSIDLALVALCSATHVALATTLLDPAALAPRGSGSADYWLDLLLSHRLAFLWAALGAMLALAYSWLFATLGGRTPGLALAGLRLQSVRGGAPTPAVAFARAAWAIPSAALGLVGFVLALFDPRGQTLHDKLTGTMVVASD